MPTVLNLSNEVVKMRSEVKKVKVFIIRKLTRQMTMLKKKKGKEEEMQRNQRRAARLLEEIHEIKVIAPDTVTKAALQKDINFEKVCQNQQASISERAVARIATHPQFSQKIQSIKDRISSFKDERSSTPSKGEKTSKPDRSEVSSEKKDEKPLVTEDIQATADEVKKVSDENQDENDNPSNEDCDTGTDVTTAHQSKEDDPEAKIKQTSTESEKIPAEVVRMRKEVKKIRVLIISKLTNQIDVLKRKKGEPCEMEDNQQKTLKLLKEIQVLRSIKPDHVTKAALQENANLEKVCENPDADPLEHATARIVTHARFVKKLQAVRQAIQEQERKAAEAEEKKKRRLEQASLPGEDSENEDDDEDDEDKDSDMEEEDDDEETEDEGGEVETGDSEDEGEELEEEDEMLNVSNVISKSQVAEVTLKTVDEHVSVEGISTPVKKQLTVQGKPERPSVMVQPLLNQAGTSNISVTVGGTVKPDANRVPLKTTTVSPAQKNKQISKPASKTLEGKNEEREKGTEDTDNESDLESSDDEEKPYFDDSTEERFHKQSSMSEESDDDGFFIGKVSKFKKKKKNPVTGEEITNDAMKSANKDTEQDHAQEDTRNKTIFKASKFESVFCTALSKGTGASQKARDRFNARAPTRFQKQMRPREGDFQAPGERKQNQSSSPNRKQWPSSFQNQKSDSWGRKEKGSFGAGRGRQTCERPQNQTRRPPPGKTFNSSRQPAEELHPSWEASRKRKEQMSQITAFQGKKIKFDDD